MGSMGSLPVHHAAAQDAILKSADKPQYQGAGFGASGSIAVAQDPIGHGIVKSGDAPQYQGAGFGASGSIAVEMDPIGHGIVKSGDKPQYQGAGFGASGSIAVEMDPIGHGIVKSGDKPQYQGAGFGASGSLPVDHAKAQHGIIRGDAKVKEGPADAGSDEIAAHIAARQAAHLDPDRGRKARAWLESILETKLEEPTLEEALKSGVRLCQALNKVYPGSVRKINESKIAFMQIENISNYIKACQVLGFNKSLLFTTGDLYEGKNMTIVADNLYELARMAARKGLGGGFELS
jgi:hypothetical protein